MRLLSSIKVTGDPRHITLPGSGSRVFSLGGQWSLSRELQVTSFEAFEIPQFPDSVGQTPRAAMHFEKLCTTALLLRLCLHLSAQRITTCTQTPSSSKARRTG